MDKHLVIFAKHPQLGRVKTRLSRGVGPVTATRFYRHTLEIIARRLTDPRWRCWLAVTPDRMVTWNGWPRNWQVIPQGRGDLGKRMHRSFLTLPSGPLVLIGSDIPAIERYHIANAFTRLGNHDVVFGPAKDGGFWLVGVRRRPRVLDFYTNVRWSCQNTLADTLENLKGYHVGFIETLADVDDETVFNKVIF